MISSGWKMNRAKIRKTFQSGFTLLEVMIALAIFAVVSGALIRNAAQTVRQTSIIQERTLAFWIAENHLNQMRSVPRDESNFPGIGSDRFDVTMADLDWEVVMDVEAPTLREAMGKIRLPNHGGKARGLPKIVQGTAHANSARTMALNPYTTLDGDAHATN